MNRPERVPLHPHPHPISRSERAIWEDIMTQNHKTAVEERDGMTPEQKKYITEEGRSSMARSCGTTTRMMNP